MSKVTLHGQGAQEGFVGRFLERSGATHFKGLGSYPTYPGVTTIGRVYYDQSKVDGHVRGGAVGADAVFGACWQEIEKNPQVGIWETPANEASIWDPSVASGYVAFSQRMTQRFHAAGKKVIAGAVNTGWPYLPKDDGGAMMRLVRDAARGADGLSFHEYGWEDMRQGATYHCLRYRRFHEYVQGDHPPLYITECGIDRTSPPGPDFGHSGWRVVLNGNEQEYIDQLLWYEQELRKDDYVRCATIFVSKPSSGWQSFEMYEGVSMKLADQLAALGPGPEPPDPPPDPPGGDVEVRVYDEQGNERDSAWLLENYGAVGVTGTGYAVVELREKKNAPATLVVSVRDELGQGLQAVAVRFSWPDGSVWGHTNQNGDVGFGMGGGAYYWPPSAGPHWVDVGGVTVDGLGMVAATNHDHLDVVLLEGEPEPDWNPLPEVAIFDQELQRRDAQWAHEMFGYQDVHDPGGADWRLVGLVQGGGLELRVRLVDPDGNPVAGERVLLGSRSIDPPVRMDADTGVDGIARFPMEGGAFRYSAVDQQGPFAVAVDGGSQVYNSVGVVMGRNDHLDVVFEGPAQPGNGRARGIDVSEWQGAIDWQAVDVDFAFIRASVCRGDGTLAEDARFRENWAGAGEAGILRGCYHYLGTEARGQARFFVDTVGAREPELGWWADLEHNGLTSQRCGEFLEAVDANLAGRGMCDVYSRASFLNRWSPIAWAEGRDLWVAHWTDAAEPTVPRDWDEWTFWQHSNQGSVPGISGRVDLDRYNGTAEELRERYGGGPTYYELVVTVEGQGQVAADPEPPYEAGTVVTLGAVAEHGWVFNRWSGDAGGMTPTVDVVMDADKAVMAHFAEDEPPDDCCAEVLRLMGDIVALLENIAEK